MRNVKWKRKIPRSKTIICGRSLPGGPEEDTESSTSFSGLSEVAVFSFAELRDFIRKDANKQRNNARKNEEENSGNKKRQAYLGVKGNGAEK